MEQLFTQLAVNAPVGAAVIVMAHLMLRAWKCERRDDREDMARERNEWRKTIERDREQWRATINRLVDGNEAAMKAQTETLQALAVAIQRHDEMSRTAIEQLRDGK